VEGARQEDRRGGLRSQGPEGAGGRDDLDRHLLRDLREARIHRRYDAFPAADDGVVLPRQVGRQYHLRDRLLGADVLALSRSRVPWTR
jgi:hypothetical protein